jgi:nucleoside phosphorylase
LQAVATRHPLVMSVGFAGGLAPASRPGDVVLPTTVVWEEATGIVSYTVPAAIRGAVHARIPPRFATRVLRGPLLSSPTIVASTEEKRAAGLRCNAVAVEMEAAALIALASERGADVMPLRVILDTADVSLAGLPPNLDSSWRARAQLMARPATWARVLSLARTIPHAASVLSQTLAAVLPGI